MQDDKFVADLEEVAEKSKGIPFRGGEGDTIGKVSNTRVEGSSVIATVDLFTGGSIEACIYVDPTQERPREEAHDDGLVSVPRAFLTCCRLRLMEASVAFGFTGLAIGVIAGGFLDHSWRVGVYLVAAAVVLVSAGRLMKLNDVERGL
jgi:hypothetical protein